MVALLLFLALLSPGGSSSAPVVALPALPDTTREIGVSLDVNPLALYSSTYGFGIEGDVEVSGLTPESELALDVRLSQRLQRGRLSFYTADPYRAPLFGFAALRGRNSSAFRFYGLGPSSDRDNKLQLTLTSADAEARVGWYPLGHSGLLLQPMARVFWDQLRGVEEDGDSALVHLDTMSLNHLNALLDESRTGVLVGAAVASDSRDNPWLPRRGFLAEVEAGRFFSLDGSGLQYNRVVGQLYGFAPAGPVALFGRAVAASVRAADGEMLPFYYLPILDKDLLTGFPSNRLFARDVLALSAGLRAPLAQVRGFYRIDGLLLGSLANAYDDLPDQFTPRVSFEEDVVVDEDGNVPLRPAAAVGLGLVNVRQHRMRFSFLMGFSPEGSLFSSYRVAFDLRDADALFR